jgi:RND family efflux transporter MFP subunit
VKLLVPIGILGASVLLAALLVALRNPPEERSSEPTPPLIRTVLAEPSDHRFRVRTQGTVMPRTESDLVPQVSGVVVWMSPDLVAGGFFEAGEPLLRIDRADYEVALESARANAARAESEFARARKERDRQKRLADRSVASEQAIDDAENAFRVAEASLRERRALLEQAERELVRTELGAPYAGRVRQKSVDVGQFVSRGTAVAKLYAVDYAEVRLPLPDRELAYLDLELARRAEHGAGDPELSPAADSDPEPEPAPPGPAVTLHAEFAGGLHAWSGRIVRTEGEIDPRSRMVQVVARVEDPYGNAAADDRPPLAVGLFVEAVIEGRVAEDAFVLPRSALRRGSDGVADQVLVVDDESRLRFREVEVLRTEHEHVVVGAGLEAGDRVCVSPLRAVTDGMRVRVSEADPGPLAGLSP